MKVLLTIIIIAILIGAAFVVFDDTPGTADDVAQAKVVGSNISNKTTPIINKAINETKQLLNQCTTLKIGLFDSVKLNTACIASGGLFASNDNELGCTLSTTNSINFCNQTDILKLQNECNNQGGQFICDLKQIN